MIEATKSSSSRDYLDSLAHLFASQWVLKEGKTDDNTEMIEKDSANSRALIDTKRTFQNSASSLQQNFKRSRAISESDFGDAQIANIPAEKLRELATKSKIDFDISSEAAKNSKKWKLKSKLISHQGVVTCVAVDPNNEWFATGSSDTVIKVWDMDTKRLRRNLTGHVEAVRGIALSVNRPYLFSCSDDHSVKCFDLETCTAIRDYHQHKGAVNSISAHPLLDYIVTGGRDKTIIVWDVRQKKSVRILRGHTDSVMSVAAQASEPQIISGGADKAVYFWDIRSGNPILQLSGHKRTVTAVLPHPHEESLITVGADKVRKWSLPTGDFCCNFNNLSLPNVVDEGPWSCAALSEKNELVICGQNGEMRFYDWSSSSLLQQKKSKNANDGILCAAFDRSASHLITGGEQKCIKIWSQI